jgi:hypothetical protein
LLEALAREIEAGWGSPTRSGLLTDAQPTFDL